MKRPKTHELLTPKELFEKYPVLKKMNLNPQYIGVLVRVGLLEGTYNSRQGTTYINEESIFPLITFRNSVLENQKIQP